MNTQICTRCKGSGTYSFNLKDGTVCYGCGGTGKQAKNNKSKIKPTCVSIHKAKVGDIIEIQSILYHVDAIKWIDYIVPQTLCAKDYNQQLYVTRVVDGRKYGFKRCVCNTDGFSIQTPKEWIGKDAIDKGI